MEEQNKKKTTFWLHPGVIRRMDGWLEEDNCRSRSEFVDKALRFYMGHLASEDTSEYLSKALAAALRGIIQDNENRMRSLIFKLCVELGVAVHTIAAHFKTDIMDQRELRRYVVDEVKRTNGQVSFDRALDLQRQLRGDEWLG